MELKGVSYKCLSGGCDCPLPVNIGKRRANLRRRILTLWSPSPAQRKATRRTGRMFFSKRCTAGRGADSSQREGFYLFHGSAHSAPKVALVALRPTRLRSAGDPPDGTHVFSKRCTAGRGADSSQREESHHVGFRFEPLLLSAVKPSMNAKTLRVRALKFWRKEIRPLLILALILFSIRSSLADWNDVPSGSMRPTILEGDRIFVNKLAYDLKVPFTTTHLAEWGNPQRGDIVVFFSPHDEKRLVKRVVGLPGDTVELRNNTLVLNGRPVEYQPLAETLLRDIPAADRAGRVFAGEQLPGRTHAVTGNPSAPALRSFAPYRVPAGQYFMMGDNRDDSFDSRYWGAVERKRIVGRATAVVMSLDKSN